jgi:hypothetical protein
MMFPEPKENIFPETIISGYDGPYEIQIVLLPKLGSLISCGGKAHENIDELVDCRWDDIPVAMQISNVI